MSDAISRPIELVEKVSLIALVYCETSDTEHATSYAIISVTHATPVGGFDLLTTIFMTNDEYFKYSHTTTFINLNELCL